MRTTRPVVLVIGGWDPSGGAGMAQDVAAVLRAGCHPAGVVAVHTVQTDGRFVCARPEDPEFFARSLDEVGRDMAVAAVKIGALGTPEHVRAIAAWVEARDEVPLVIDPVLVSSSGGVLTDGDTARAAWDLLYPRAALLTPNLVELDALTSGWEGDARARARALAGRLGAAVLVKGGHDGRAGDRVTDWLVVDGEEVDWTSARQDGPDVRGTGCALASLCAAFLAHGIRLRNAVEEARALLQAARRNAYALGNGAGPGHLDWAR